VKQLIQQVDPLILDQYAWSRDDILRRRSKPLETVKYLSILRRALQALPPRELQFVYLQRAKGLIQEETRKIYSVRQQNISYRLIRASQRIVLHYKLMTLSSETSIRRRLLDLGFSADLIRVITGIVRTSSQTATAEALGVSPGSIRYSYSKVLNTLEVHDQTQAIRLLQGQISETEIRRRLINQGFPLDHVQWVAGVIRTGSQLLIARILKVSPDEIRCSLNKAFVILGVQDWESRELRLLQLMARNLKQLRCTRGQERWAWKKERIGSGDLPLSGSEGGVEDLISVVGSL
jgi:hypothetical protein